MRIVIMSARCQLLQAWHVGLCPLLDLEAFCPSWPILLLFAIPVAGEACCGCTHFGKSEGYLHRLLICPFPSVWPPIAGYFHLLRPFLAFGKRDTVRFQHLIPQARPFAFLFIKIIILFTLPWPHWIGIQ